MTINFSWIWWVMKVHIICYIPAEISYLENIFLMRLSQNELDQSNCMIFKSNIFLEQNDEIAWFFCMLIRIHGNYKLIERLWGEWGQIWVWQLRSQYSNAGCISRNWWINLVFLYGDTNSGELKVAMIIIGWAWLKMGLDSKTCCISWMNLIQSVELIF